MRQTAIVTGANSGIGLETARGLAAAGYHVILLCRSAERAAVAKADIDGSLSTSSTEVVLCDLGLQADVRRVASDLDSRPRLDLLVNNAGVTLRSRTETAEGHDTMLAVNHLGPFLLTNLLLPLLRRSSPSRIVNVASEAHKFSPLHLEDLEATRGYGFFGFPRYGETKLMNILFTRELARRIAGSGVTANCVHPGGVYTNLGGPPAPLRPLLRAVLRSPADGAKTSLVVATDPALANVSGSYFANGRVADAKLSRHARNDKQAAELWTRSAALVGLSETSVD
ncbi:MAG: SDR family NAD(P)-dependent oxidoreductase [Acidimicrobiales bacterium]